MRILILGNVPPVVTGGAEVQALLLAQAWVEAGHTVTVAGTDNLPGANCGVTIVRLPLWRASRLTRGVTYLINTLFYLWQHAGEFDIVYCRFLKEHATVASIARLIGILRCPVVACPASTSVSGEVHAIMRSRFRGIWIGILRRSQISVNAMSAVIEREVHQLGFEPSRISRIPNGVRLSKMARSNRAINKPRRLLFVGRLVWEKALDTLLDALHALAAAGVGFELYIVGDGPLRGCIENRIEALGLGQSVMMAGSITRERIEEYYADADLFVLSSRIEGMPGALLEAMAHGLPVISTRVSGADEIVDQAFGWLVPVDDAKALSTALESALCCSSENLVQMGAAARARATDVFDVGRIAQRYVELFEALMLSQGHDTGRGGRA